MGSGIDKLKKFVEPPAVLYMGKDKFENEKLIEHAWDIDVWFHVEHLSSAHVYLRLSPCRQATSTKESASSKAYYTPPATTTPKPDAHLYGTVWSDLPESLITDLGQLTKANSIEGSKKDHVSIIYTPASNLKKTGDMQIGEVSFHDHRKVKKIKIPTKNNEVLNRLNKTKREEFPDLAELKSDYMKQQTEKRKDEARVQREQQAQIKMRQIQEKEKMSYERLFNEEHMTSNKDMADDDDFM